MARLGSQSMTTSRYISKEYHQCVSNPKMSSIRSQNPKYLLLHHSLRGTKSQDQHVNEEQIYHKLEVLSTIPC